MIKVCTIAAKLSHTCTFNVKHLKIDIPAMKLHVAICCVAKSVHV